jgi:putative hydrolase of the HAD superfamily
MKDFDLIIFDMDGTLYQRCPEIDSVFPEAMIKLLSKKTGKPKEELKIEFDKNREKLSQLINGQPTYTLTLLYYYDIDLNDYINYINKMADIENCLKPDKKTTEAIEKIYKNYRIALFTTNNEATTERILKALGLHRFFPKDKRITVDTFLYNKVPRREIVEYVKPGLKGFKYVLSKFNANPKRTLMVGDSITSDIQPAEKLKIKTYHVKNPDSLYALPKWLGINNP